MAKPRTTPAHRRPLRRALGLATTTLVAAALLAGSPAPTTAWNQGSAEATLWQLLNGARVNNGRRPLQQHSTLVGLARWRSRDMIDRNYFDHYVLGTGYQVYHWYDTNGLSYVWGGENIGWNSGYSDAESPIKIHEGFMNSPSHRGNLLESSWTHGGVGAAAADGVNFLGKLRNPRVYTELFMQARTSSAPPPPPSNPPPPPSGGGGGSAPRPAAPAPSATPTPARMTVDVAGPPSAGVDLDGSAVLVAARSWPDQGMQRASVLGTPSIADDSGEATVAAAGARVAAAEPPPRSLLDSFLASLLGIFAG